MSFAFIFSLSAQPAAMMGFSEAGAKIQAALEAKFDSYLKADNIDEWMKYMSARPPHVGSPYDKKVVDFMAEKFAVAGVFHLQLSELAYQINGVATGASLANTFPPPFSPHLLYNKAHP
jgi:hypothetical protein